MTASSIVGYIAGALIVLALMSAVNEISRDDLRNEVVIYGH